jgi:hypothetical protein
MASSKRIKDQLPRDIESDFSSSYCDYNSDIFKEQLSQDEWYQGEQSD